MIIIYAFINITYDFEFFCKNLIKYGFYWMKNNIWIVIIKLKLLSANFIHVKTYFYSVTRYNIIIIIITHIVRIDAKKYSYK